MRVGTELVFTGAGMVDQSHELQRFTLNGVELRDKFFEGKFGYAVRLYPLVKATANGVDVLDLDAHSAICGGVDPNLEMANRLYYLPDFRRNLRMMTKVLKASLNLSTLHIQGQCPSCLLLPPPPPPPSKPQTILHTPPTRVLTHAHTPRCQGTAR